ncbi:MAG: tRNA lysidine(34) synthetase TilS [Planctomycetaceae bacterium]
MTGAAATSENYQLYKSEFLDRLACEFERLKIANATILLAVSGGADSTAMLRACAELREKLHIVPVVAHLNHGIRGPAADDDAAWVHELCRQQNIACFSEKTDVPGQSAKWKTGLEETARKLRYEFLTRIARQHNCRFVLTAHTADDQAETILHHIIRGTGLGGLKGIADTSILSSDLMLARPLKIFTRKEIIAFLAALGQGFRTDDTNDDDGMTRNRLRNSLLPQLEREFNPQVKSALCRLGVQAAEVQETLQRLAERMFLPAIEAIHESSVRINCAACAEIPPLVVREGLIRLWESQNWPRQQMGSNEWRQLERMVFDPDHSTLTLPGTIRATRRGTLLILTKES